MALFWQASLVQEEVVPLYVWLHTEQDQHRYDLRVWAGLTRQGRLMSARDLEVQVWLGFRGKAEKSAEAFREQKLVIFPFLSF